MRDILGREIKDGDLVVVKATGRHSSGLDIGIFNGASVRFRGGKVASYTQYFLVDNPTGKELEVKEQILEEIKASQELAEKKKAMPKIKQRDLVRGRAYKDVDGSEFYYLGKADVIETDGRETIDEHEGVYLYVSKWLVDRYPDDLARMVCINARKRKTPIKLCEDLGVGLALEDSYTYKRVGWRDSNYVTVTFIK